MSLEAGGGVPCGPNPAAILLFCSEVKWRKWRVFHVTVTASRGFHRASSTRPLINGQHNCVHAWSRRGIILKICCRHRFCSFQSYPQSTEENALQFTRLAYGSLQHSRHTRIQLGWTFYMVQCVKLTERIFEFAVLLFDCFFIAKM